MAENESNVVEVNNGKQIDNITANNNAADKSINDKMVDENMTNNDKEI